MPKKNEESPDLKSFNLRLPKETWRFLKKVSFMQEKTMTDIVNQCIEKYKKNFENKLTECDTDV